MLMMRNNRGGLESEESLRMAGGWQKNQQQPTAAAMGLGMGMGMEQNGVGAGGELFVKVMTDDQLELLRRQISVYASICEQLVDMHKAVTAQQDLAGMRLGNIYCDPMMTSATHKITARQRWTPTPEQLQKLERIFEKGNGTPNKQKIKEITIELSQHGQISETNVYNWFQNRRARSKRKQLVVASSSADSEVETDVESPKDKKTKPENIQSHKNPASRDENMFFSNPKMTTEMHCLETDPNKGEAMFQSDRDLRSSSAFGQLSFYENVSPNSRMDQLMGKMEIPGGFSPYQLGEGYDLDMVG